MVAVPPRAKTPKLTDGGAPVPPGNVARLAAAQQILTCGGYAKARAALIKTFGVSRATAERDITEAYRLIASDSEAERPFIRARELERLGRIAAAAEALGDAAGLSAAVRASQQIAKLTGIEAPTEVAIVPKQERDWSAVPIEERRRILAAFDAVPRRTTDGGS